MLLNFLSEIIFIKIFKKKVQVHCDLLYWDKTEINFLVSLKKILNIHKKWFIWFYSAIGFVCLKRNLPDLLGFSCKIHFFIG